MNGGPRREADDGQSDDHVQADEIRAYARRHPGASAIVICARLGIAPRHLDAVRAVLEGDSDEERIVKKSEKSDDEEPECDASDSRDGKTESPDSDDPGESGGAECGCAVGDKQGDGRSHTHDTTKSTDGDTMDTETTDETPGVETAKHGDNAAFVAAIEFFHDHLDDQLPDTAAADTPREHFTDGRGWDAETVDAAKLGYAPADPSALLDHLMRLGFDREAILGTGLFWEDGLAPIWQGRLVLPYLEDGRPTFAISRRLGDDGHDRDRAGAYGGAPAKYHKIPRQDCADVEEPIFGLDTIRAGEPVLITEGIADAITAHEAGYPCVSPVTVQFKHDDRQALVDALAEGGVPRAYIVQDAERPGSDLDTSGRLSLPQHGPGLKGAVATGAYLADHADGLDAYLAELPRPGLDKVDLDDYLREWSDTLAPILASAKPATEHPAHDPERHAVDTARREQAQATRDTGSEEGGDRSALYDLDIRDVTGLSWSHRGPNPLGHHGDSENYFVLLEEHGLAYDHKYKAAYTPLTYLLCEADERRPDDPNGKLEDSEVFAAWRHAKRERLIPDDDPIPHRALRHIALDAGLCTPGDIEDGWRLPADAYNGAIRAVDADHGVDPGRSTLGGEPSAPIPYAALEGLTDHERDRYRRKHGLDGPTTAEARQRLRDTVFREMRAGNTTLIDAPTALGKSHTVATEPWIRRAGVTGEAPVVHLHATRQARDEAAGVTERHGGECAVLRGRRELSPLARGDHDPVDPEDDEAEEPELVVTIDGIPASEWFDQMCDERGLPFSTALVLARERNDQGLDELPPIGAEDPAVAQWDGVPRDEDGAPAVDVVHATHPFAYVPSLRSHTNVVIDEQPDYAGHIGQDRVRRMVTAYLQEIDAPVSTFEAFVGLGRFDHGGTSSDAGHEQDVLDGLLASPPTPPRSWYADHPDAHALGPDLTRALWRALRWEDADANNRRSARVLHEPPRFDSDGGGGYGGTWLSVVIDEENTIQSIRNTPDFSQARSVIGLDAHPSRPMWDLNAVPGMDYDEVLDPDERALWRRFERGLTVVQIGEATRPRSGEKAREWTNENRVRAVLDRLQEGYGDALSTAITTVQVEPVIRRLLAEVTGRDVSEVETMHYAAERSRNDFADETLGYLYGCMDPGDGMILDALAELGKDATPATERDEDGELHRAKGRGFDGPDADTAAALLASVRENHVAQGAGRYARNPDDPDSRATVYVHTDAAPPGFVDYVVPGVEWLATDTQRAIIDELAQRPTATTREIADAVGCTKEHVRTTLARLEERGVTGRSRATGDHGADEWHGSDPTTALVDLGALQTTNDRLQDSIRWSLAVRPGQDGPPPGTRGEDGGPPPTTALAGGTGPPDPAD